MLSPKKSPGAVFCRQIKLKIANGDIGEAQRDPCYGAKKIQITNIGFLEMTIWNLLVVGLSHKISENSLIDQ